MIEVVLSYVVILVASHPTSGMSNPVSLARAQKANVLSPGIINLQTIEKLQPANKPSAASLFGVSLNNHLSLVFFTLRTWRSGHEDRMSRTQDRPDGSDLCRMPVGQPRPSSEPRLELLAARYLRFAHCFVEELEHGTNVGEFVGAQTGYDGEEDP